MNNDKPVKFSVVIPTYNREKFIVETLNTVLRQKYSHYEIIVVDNCSTDNTEDVLQPFIQSGKVQLIKLDRNYERSHARNIGMENATGDFLILLDSDDFMYPNNLTDAAAFVKNNPDFKFFHNLYELVDSDGKVVRRYKFPSLKNQIKAIASGNFLSCNGNFIHRDIYQKYRFDDDRPLIGLEDWEFWMRILADYKLGRIPKINGAIQQHDNRSVYTQDISALEKGSNSLIEKFSSDPHLSDVYAKYLSWIHANCYLYLAVMANDGKLYDEAKKHLKKAIEIDHRVIFSLRLARIVRKTVFKL